MYYFKTRYFRNPLDNATPYKSGKGESLLSRGLYNIKRKLDKPKLNVNPDRNAKRAIHGMAYLYGFRYRSFMEDNFDEKRYSVSYNGKKCSLERWCVLLSAMSRQFKTVHKYPNLSRLIRSRYAKYIAISHLSRYYHRRRKYVKNARSRLSNLGDNQRYMFTGTFERFGSKPNGQLTILLTNIKHGTDLVTDHLWFNATKGFRRLGHIDEHAKIRFKARVHHYQKGRLVKRYDYQLSYPTQISKL